MIFNKGKGKIKMRKIRKLLTVFAAFFLVLGLTTNVQAEADQNQGTSAKTRGSITIQNTLEGKTYTIYRMLDLESYKKPADQTDKGAYSYKVLPAWKGFLESGVGAQFFELKEQDYVVVHPNAQVTAEGQFVNGKILTDAALQYAKEHNIHATQHATAQGNTLTFSDLDLGYYLVDSDAGALCALGTTDNNNVTIKEKNGIPTLEKQVQEKPDNSWGNKNDANIGDTVNFKATITTAAGAMNYKLIDKMEAGLTLKSDSIAVKIDETIHQAGANRFTITSTTDRGFEIKFADTWIQSLPVGTTIVVEYQATLNENAVIAGNGNKNSANLQYGDKTESFFETGEKETHTYTWPIGIYKYTQNGEEPEATETALADAEFYLSTNKTSAGTTEEEVQNGADVIKFKPTTASEGTIPTYQKASGEGTVSIIKTDATGKFILQGLDAGTYYLHEFAAPDGFNKLAGPIKVVITHEALTTPGSNLGSTVESTVDVDATDNFENTTDDIKHENTNIAVKVLNTTGALLPSTGGMGTTLLYTIGAGLIVISGILLITKKRMSHE